MNRLKVGTLFAGLSPYVTTHQLLDPVMKLIPPKLNALVTILIPIPAAAAESADMVFTNAEVYTVNEKQPWAEAVAIEIFHNEALGSSRNRVVRMLTIRGKKEARLLIGSKC